MNWVLILMVFGSHNTAAAASVTQVPGFYSEQQCLSAGDAAKVRFTTTMHEMRYVCLQVGH